MSMLTGDQIPLYRLIALLKGIELEGTGIKVSRGRSCLTIVKSEFGWTGNRETIKGYLKEHIDEEKVRLGVPLEDENYGEIVVFNDDGTASTVTPDANLARAYETDPDFVEGLVANYIADVNEAEIADVVDSMTECEEDTHLVVELPRCVCGIVEVQMNEDGTIYDASIEIKEE